VKRLWPLKIVTYRERKTYLLIHILKSIRCREISFPEELTLIFTASALIISLITLWFSHLKGPDIELCNQPETELEDWAETDLNNYLQNKHIPNYLNIKPVQLVFVNNGSKTGAITNIETKFEPNEKFKPFVRSEFFYTEKELPLSVDEGGTGIIRLSSRLEVIDWNRDFEKKLPTYQISNKLLKSR